MAVHQHKHCRPNRKKQKLQNEQHKVSASTRCVDTCCVSSWQKHKMKHEIAEASQHTDILPAHCVLVFL